DLLVMTLTAVENGDIDARPQSTDGVSLAPRVDVADARIDWSMPAQAIERLVRAMTPAPGAWTTLHDERVKVGPVTLAESGDLAPGVISVRRREVLVGTGNADIVLGDVKAQGKRAMPATDWVRGLRLETGELFA
ncbi:MAG: hypothetical protein VW239_11370, partial [Candidatus Nanopelagicales bacterium]